MKLPTTLNISFSALYCFPEMKTQNKQIFEGVTIRPSLPVTMIKFKETVCLFSLMNLALCRQPTAIKGSLYKRIYVEANSWQEMEFGERQISGNGWGREHRIRQRLCYLWIAYRLSLVQCGAICGADNHCEAYSVESSNCHLARARGLVGVSSDSPSAKAVYLNTKIKEGRWKIFLSLNSAPIFVIFSSWCLDLLGTMVWVQDCGRLSDAYSIGN